jgi:hypothetical protein
VPLHDLDLINLHQRVVKALDAYSKRGDGDNGPFMIASTNCKGLPGTLAGWPMMGRTKEIALTGETFSVGAIKMLAHLPTPPTHADQVPGRFEVLNDLIRGREVFPTWALWL